MNTQLDLFSAAGAATRPDSDPGQCTSAPPSCLDDATLIDAVANASNSACLAVAHEAGQRRLIAAIPALERLCRRLKGFGRDQPLREQMAALDGLCMIGGRDAAAAVARILVDHVVDDPGLQRAVAAAASLGARLPASLVAVLLRHPEPQVRADACRCARGGAEVVRLMIELLSDLNLPVAREAACALGRLGRDEAHSALTNLLRTEPTPVVIEAIAAVADDDDQVLLGRIGCTRPDLAPAIIAALETMETPRAASIADKVRKSWTADLP